MNSLQTSIDSFSDGIKATAALYERLGIDAFFVLQVPNQKVDPRRAYRIIGETSNSELETISITPREHKEYQRIPNDIIERSVTADKRIDLSQQLCDEKRCLIGTAGSSKYLDDDHLSDAGAATLANHLRSYLSEER